jgi:hypothetical protein
LRERRLGAQEQYERLVTEEIQRVSSIALAGDAQAYTALNLETPSIREAYAKYTTINSYLDAFDALYKSYDKIGSELRSMEDTAAKQYDVQVAVDAGKASPADLQAKQEEYDAAAARAAAEEATVVMLRDQVSQAFRDTEVGWSIRDNLVQRLDELSSIILAALAPPLGATGATGPSGP